MEEPTVKDHVWILDRKDWWILWKSPPSKTVYSGDLSLHASSVEHISAPQELRDVFSSPTMGPAIKPSNQRKILPLML